jgi:Tetratricopeptide repeat
MTLGFRRSLALTHQAAGDLENAIPLLEITLAQRRRVLGPDNPDILTSCHNLALAYKEAGDMDHAIPCSARPSPTASTS